MRILPLILMVACGPASGPVGSDPDTAWAPDPGWENDSVPTPRVLLDGLDEPAGLAVADGQLWLAETGTGRIWVHDGREASVWADGLDAPGRLAADGDGLVVQTLSQVLLLGEGEERILAENPELPTEVALGLDSIWWVDEGTGSDGEVWRADRDGSGAVAVAVGLERPRGLALVGERAVVAETGNWRLIKVAPDRALEALATISGTVRDVAADCTSVVFATESSRWPYPGFISTLDEGVEDRLSESPPQPARILLTGDRVIWATKQSIHSIPREGGTLRTVVLRTNVADMLVSGDTLIWSDPERGAVLAVGL